LTKFGLYRVKLKVAAVLPAGETAINLKLNLRGDFKKISVKIAARVKFTANL